MFVAWILGILVLLMQLLQGVDAFELFSALGGP